MKIVIVGATGLIGTRLVDILRAAGHDVIPASPSTGVDTITGRGVAAAFSGADVVVDLPNSRSFDDAELMHFFETSTRTVVGAAKDAGVQHHVLLSIVGADRMSDIGYMRAKVAQERIVEQGGVPYTIVRSTQFFEYIPFVIEVAATADTVPLSPVLMQPVAAADVSDMLAEAATTEPTNGVSEFAGPEAVPLVELGRRVLHDRHDPRTVIESPRVGYFYAAVNDESLTPGHDPAVPHRLAPTTYNQWARELTASANGKR
ncbi:SDR family oxidoreductase [Curtobacterium sp. L1-20]|uniref:SDR family oxidoreductase n=1 Tax=Curtobacterium sp. L1-20 TaxID=3138181 RepID=UPI003B51DE8D